PGPLSRDLELLQLRRLSGAPYGWALSAEGGQGHALRAHLEWLRPCLRAYPDRGAGELPERRRLGQHPRGAAALHERARDPAGSGCPDVTPADLSRARILVTNDDGIHAPGLDALVEIASQLSSDVWVVAPEVNQSGAGHSLSLSHPIRCREVSEAKYAI